MTVHAHCRHATGRAGTGNYLLLRSPRPVNSTRSGTGGACSRASEQKLTTASEHIWVNRLTWAREKG